MFLSDINQFFFSSHLYYFYYSYSPLNVPLLHTHIFSLSVYIMPIFYFISTVYTLYTSYLVTPVYIHDDQLRLMDKSGNDRQFLLHTMGISRDRLCKILRQFKHICIFADTLLTFLRTHFKNICHKIQKLYPRHKVVQIRIVRNICRLCFTCKRLFLYGGSVDQDFPFLKL